MGPHCVPCNRDFKNKKALQQHERDSPAHKPGCTTRRDSATAQYDQPTTVTAPPLHHPPNLAATPPNREPPAKRKRRVKQKPTIKWSMYPSLHDEVSTLLQEHSLSFTFHNKDDSNSCTADYDTNIMGRFTCSNTSCRAVWTSKQIAITIRRYAHERYNARVYYQSCKRCRMLGEAQLDGSYADRVAYRLKKWSGIEMEPPPFSGQSEGPHLSELCEGCKHGHCSKM